MFDTCDTLQIKFRYWNASKMAGKISAQLILCDSHEYCKIRARMNYPHISAEIILQKIIRYFNN